MKWSLKKKILLPTIALIVLVMGTSTGITYLVSTKTLNQDALDQLTLICKSRVEIIDVWIDDVKTLMGTAATRSAYQAVLRENTEDASKKANAELGELLKIAVGISYIHVANGQGQVPHHVESG
ncbi:MAG TPA: hypothetical protein DCE18_04090 [Syntrophobacteraceae bacterium]|nr:hypothetical protein [Syntrophobacteraceae bacterium]